MITRMFRRSGSRTAAAAINAAVLVTALTWGTVVAAPLAAAASAVPAPPSTTTPKTATAARGVDDSTCVIRPSSAADAQPITDATLGGEDDDGPIYAFIKDTVRTSFQDETIGGAGWLFNLVLGRKGNQDGSNDQQIEQELQQQRNQLNAIQSSINALANQLTNAEFSIKAQLAQTQYDLEVNGSSNNIAHLQDMVQNLCNLANHSATKSNTDPYHPDSVDLDHIKDIRDNAPAALGTMSTSLLGKGGIIASFRSAFWANQAAANSAAPSTAIWTADYVDAMHNLVDYYIGLAAEVFNGYAESIHWDSPADPANSIPALAPADSHKIGDLYDQLRADVAAWTKAATDDLPALPTGTAVDVRTGSNDVGSGPTAYTMWASSPVVIPNTPALADGKTHPYCARAAAMCLYTVWQPSSTDSAVAATAVVPALTPVAAMLATQPLGIADWRIPTVKDWAGLVRPSYTGDSKALVGLDPNDGVAAWAAAEEFPILQTQTVAGPVGPVSTIPPVVVSDNTAQVLTFNDPKSAAPTAPAASASVGAAGRLALVRTVTTVPPDLPAQAPGAAASIRRPPTTGNAPSIRAAGARKAASQGTSSPPARRPVTGTLNQSTTFSTPANSCTTGYQQPSNANAVSVVVTGAAGGSGGKGSTGGQGGTTRLIIPLQPGGVIYPRVGGIGGSSTDYLNSNGVNISTPGQGGIGGGGIGGGSPVDWAGGGGGGLSGISADTGCTQWLVIGGGGGGGGGIDRAGSPSHNDTLNGGHGCLNQGCAGATPTLNGASAADQGAGSGGDLITGGGGGAHANVHAGTGTSGTSGQGGIGGSAINSNNPLHEYFGGGGGGGGGGYAGGGGGGASTAAYGGAGGGGGGGYLAEGTRAADVGIAPAGSAAQIVITPLLVPDGQIGSPSTDTTVASVLRVDRNSGAVLRGPELNLNTDWQNWATENVGSDGTTPYYLLHNLGSDTCLVNTEQAGQALTMAPCDPGNPHQAWKFEWQTNGTYALWSEWSANGAALVASAPLAAAATPATTATYQSGVPAQQWTVLPTVSDKAVPSITITIPGYGIPVIPDGSRVKPVAHLPANATGAIQFSAQSYDGTGPTYGLGSAQIQNGAAALTAPAVILPAAIYIITGTYSGDNAYAGASATLQVQVKGTAPPALLPSKDRRTATAETLPATSKPSKDRTLGAAEPLPTKSNGDLASTGLNVVGLALFAFALVGTGVLVVLSRRRRATPHR